MSIVVTCKACATESDKITVKVGPAAPIEPDQSPKVVLGRDRWAHVGADWYCWECAEGMGLVDDE
jgi:hypothetical protein